MGLLKLVRASLALVAGTREEESLDPTDGGLNVHLVGGAVGGQTVAQGDPNAGGADAWHTVDAAVLAELVLILARQADGTQRSNPTPSTATSSAALEASHVLKASAGTFRSLLVEIDETAPSATYYVQLLTASATVPGDGAVTFLRPPQTVIHVVGTPDFVTFDEGAAGIAFTVGCTACISSTRFTKTSAGLTYGLFAGSVL